VEHIKREKSDKLFYTHNKTESKDLLIKENPEKSSRSEKPGLNMGKI